MSERRDVGAVFLGDSFVAGYGDAKALGWVGRVVARSLHPDLDLTAYNLGVRGNTSGDVLARWKTEALPRWEGRGEQRLVVSVGYGDLTQGTSLARHRLNLANLIDESAARGIDTFVVGPPPSLDPAFNDRLRGLVDAQADVCERRATPYVDCFAPLSQHEQWHSDVSAGRDSVHPGQIGYGLIAWLVLHGGWDRWLGIAELG